MVLHKPVSFLLLSCQAEDRESYKTPHPKVSSPTVDSTTDSVVPVMVPQVEKEVVVLSQDSGVPSSSLGGEDDLSAQLWTVSSGYQNVVAVSNTHGGAVSLITCLQFLQF